ncbi:putative salt-induced outer membrane protein [Polymorphobacter multimanifer]|uniref:Putative salt-induced outer membrane protein n=1 Tax=Polymorphobacter multimanifer TaxID=1070431 RepID=A0A841L776_9SPHN|nr:DUF481 domain-containing protein [Polymorphobacter multimanifer]MBB6227431.1 putative salt-induced outer membrane protein [Polymorphobacter multimanifer]
MRIWIVPLLAVVAAPALAKPIPSAVAAMIEAARNDPAKLAVVAEMARATNPGSVREINARIAAINADRARAREQALAEQRYYEGWKGSGEVGGFASSGNTNTQGVALGVNLSKETRQWKHAARGFVDYQRQDGVVSRERYLASYQGNYNINPSMFSLLAVSYEKDEFSGFEHRFSQSLGIGQKLVAGPRLLATVEGGPALRQTQFTDGLNETNFAARVAGNVRWQLSERLKLTEDASYFYDGNNNSLQALTALNAKINGSLTARLSHQINTESNPPLGRRNSDQVSRGTIVYSF